MKFCAHCGSEAVRDFGAEGLQECLSCGLIYDPESDYDDIDPYDMADIEIKWDEGLEDDLPF